MTGTSKLFSEEGEWKKEQREGEGDFETNMKKIRILVDSDNRAPSSIIIVIILILINIIIITVWYGSTTEEGTQRGRPPLPRGLRYAPALPAAPSPPPTVTAAHQRAAASSEAHYSNVHNKLSIREA